MLHHEGIGGSGVYRSIIRCDPTKVILAEDSLILSQGVDSHEISLIIKPCEGMREKEREK